MIASRVAALLPRPAVPPAMAPVNGNAHMLAYITPQEAELLAARGGGPGAAPGMQLAHGLRAFDDSDGNTDGGASGPGQGDDGGYGGWGGGDVGGPSGPGQGDDAGYGGWGAASDPADGPSGPGQGDDAGYGGWGGGGSGGANISGAEGGNTSGASDSGYYGAPGDASPPTPAAPAPPPRDLAGEAEARARARFAGSTGQVWMDALRARFSDEARGIIERAYSTTRSDARDRLLKSGYVATPLAHMQLAGIDRQRDQIAGGIDGKWSARERDYQGRAANSLAQAIAAARASMNPDMAEAIADQYVAALQNDISSNPGSPFEASFTQPVAAPADPVAIAQRRGASDALLAALANARGASTVGA